MRKKFLRGILALALMIGGGTAVIMDSFAVNACDECDVSSDDPTKRTCGKCGHRGMTKKKAEFKNGKWHVTYKCDNSDCGHIYVRKTYNMSEI